MKEIRLASPKLGRPERRALARVIKSGMLAQGPEVAHFETEFSATVSDGRCAVAVNSGTSALHLALLAAGIGKGDEVLVPSFTFAGTVNAILLTGATPVFCDVSLQTFTIDLESVEANIGSRTRAIVPVHLYGLPADMKSLKNKAKRHGLLMIEDAAQAHLAKIGEQKVGTFGDAGIFSLYPTKNLTSGEGGMVVTRSETLARKVRLLRNQGMLDKYQHEMVGFNNRMSELHAAVGRSQLRRLETATRRRIENAKFLTEAVSGAKTPTVPDGFTHVYHQYTLLIEQDRDRFAHALQSEFGIQSGVYYSNPVHRFGYLPKAVRMCDVPNTELLASMVLSIPVHNQLKASELSRIAAAINTLGNAGR